MTFNANVFTLHLGLLSFVGPFEKKSFHKEEVSNEIF
jgi:hypothetical protein